MILAQRVGRERFGAIYGVILQIWTVPGIIRRGAAALGLWWHQDGLCTCGECWQKSIVTCSYTFYLPTSKCCNIRGVDCLNVLFLTPTLPSSSLNLNYLSSRTRHQIIWISILPLLVSVSRLTRFWLYLLISERILKKLTQIASIRTNSLYRQQRRVPANNVSLMINLGSRRGRCTST